MSRPPIRDVFRLAHLGLEKVALACAAFSLMHATARADESVPSIAVTVDQWAAQSHAHSGAQSGAQSGPQATDPAVRHAVQDDPWANPAASRFAQDDPWTVPPVNQFRSGAQLHVATPERQTLAVAAQPVPAIQPVQQARPANVLAMDGSRWNETPRGRSPGLIASNNAWRKRIVPETAAPIERSVAQHDLRTRPAAMLKLDSNLQLDPWSAPANASKGADNAADWKNLKLASAHQPRTCNRDWSIFAGAGCMESGNAAGSAPDNANPRPLPGADLSKSEQRGSVTMFRQSRMLINATAGGPQVTAADTQLQASGNTVRSLIAITPDGRWRAPLVIDAEAAPRK
jgi:hypothetical protein